MATKRNGTAVKPKSVAEDLLAKKIAGAYRRKVMAISLYAKPWRQDIPLQELKVFGCFVSAARIVKSIDADYQEFVRAQFEAWDGPKDKIPMPSQLCSDGAVTRYTTWVVARSQEIKTLESISSRKKNGEDPYPVDRLKLRRLMKSWDLPREKVLIAVCTEFSRSFLRHMGVWAKVKKKWISHREGEGEEGRL